MSGNITVKRTAGNQARPPQISSNSTAAARSGSPEAPTPCTSGTDVRQRRRSRATRPRERFEAVARSVRDILSQRWVRTERTYHASENPKRVYYLSMEFLIGRSLANNVTNLLLDPVAKQYR